MCNCNQGIVLAESKNPNQPGLYAFRCECRSDIRTRRFPFFSSKEVDTYIPDWIDTAPTLDWYAFKVENHETKEPEFQDRLARWGRPLFKNLHARYLNWKKQCQQ